MQYLNSGLATQAFLGGGEKQLNFQAIHKIIAGQAAKKKIYQLIQEALEGKVEVSVADIDTGFKEVEDIDLARE